MVRAGEVAIGRFSQKPTASMTVQRPHAYFLILPTSMLIAASTRRAHGTITPIWTSCKDTRFRKTEYSGQFTSLQVRAVHAFEVHP